MYDVRVFKSTKLYNQGENGRILSAPTLQLLGSSINPQYWLMELILYYDGSVQNVIIASCILHNICQSRQEPLDEENEEFGEWGMRNAAIATIQFIR